MRRDPFVPTWYLLAERPGWRSDAVRSEHIAFAGGALELEPVREAPPEPSERCVLGPCDDLVLLDAEGRRVLLVTVHGQIRRIIGPFVVEVGDGAGAAVPAPAPTVTLAPTAPAHELADDCALPALSWPEATWAPDGVIVCGGRILVRDATVALTHEFDGCGAWVASHPGTAIPDADGTVLGYAKAGTFHTGALDSGLAECEWHRVRLAGSVPPGGRVTVQTFTSDVELGLAELSALLPERWAPAGTWGDATLDEWDVLVPSEPGRYLWLALLLGGDGTVTPRVNDVEVHFPRATSRRHLPAAFQTTVDRGSFVDRFLALTDTVRGSVVRHVEDVPVVLDAYGTPADPASDFLGWLSRWLGVELADGLPEQRRRRLLAEAAELYRSRGTPAGVERHASLWLGRRVQVIERFRLRRWAVAGHGRLGDATELFGAEIVRRLQLDEFATIGRFALIEVGDPALDPFRVTAHRFTAVVHARCADDVDQLTADAARILEVVKPAHTATAVAVVTARMAVGRQATLGVDSVVAGPLEMEPLGEGRLGETAAVAGEPGLAGRPGLGVSARVARAALL
jgi:phage tail-like protein